MEQGIPRTIYGEEHEIFRRTVRHFLEAEIVPCYAEWEAAGITPRAIWRRAGELGLLGTSIPEAYGGTGVGFLYEAVLLEELGRLGLGAPAFDMHAQIVTPFIVAFGSEEQKRRWLPRIAAGEAIVGIGMTEPNTGSDLAAVRTRAVREGNKYVINGAKTFITNGHNADMILLVAKTDPERGAKGVSLFLLDTAIEGFRRGRNLKKIGNKAQDTAELFFDDMAVPPDSMLGEENDGWHLLMHGLVRERMVVAVRSMAMAQSALAQTVDYTKSRIAFGQPVFDFQNTRFKLAEAAADIEVGRVFMDRCIALHAREGLSMDVAAKAKLWMTELADRVLDDCLQLHGGYGYMWEFPIARLWADARVHRIYAGSNEIMKHIISRGL